MGLYSVSGWYAADGRNENVSETVDADNDAAAREAAREMFDNLNKGGGYAYTVRRPDGSVLAD